MGSVTVCTLQQISLGWSNQGGWNGHVAYTIEVTHVILLSLERLKVTWQDIRMHLKEKRCEGVPRNTTAHVARGTELLTSSWAQLSANCTAQCPLRGKFWGWTRPGFKLCATDSLTFDHSVVLLEMAGRQTVIGIRKVQSVSGYQTPSLRRALKLLGKWCLSWSRTQDTVDWLTTRTDVPHASRRSCNDLPVWTPVAEGVSARFSIYWLSW
jgi:hypothetical protein